MALDCIKEMSQIRSASLALQTLLLRQDGALRLPAKRRVACLSTALRCVGETDASQCAKFAHPTCACCVSCRHSLKHLAAACWWHAQYPVERPVTVNTDVTAGDEQMLLASMHEWCRLPLQSVRLDVWAPMWSNSTANKPGLPFLAADQCSPTARDALLCCRTLRVLRTSASQTEFQELYCRMRNLETLILEGCCTIASDGLSRLHVLTQLTELDLCRCENVSDACLVHISQLPLLRSLRLSECAMVGARGLSALASVSHSLTDLDVSELPRVNDAAMRSVGRLTALRRLALRGCISVSADGLLELSSLTQLTELDLAGSSVNDDGLRAVSKSAPELTTLLLARCCRVTDSGVSFLESLRHLETLSISWCPQLGDAGLQHVQALTSLRVLDASNTAVTHAGTQEIGQLLQQLEGLDLSSCRILDKGVAHVASCATVSCRLRSLRVANCGLSTASLDAACTIPSLTEIDMSDNTFCSPWSTADCFVKLPLLRVLHVGAAQKAE